MTEYELDNIDFRADWEIAELLCSQSMKLALNKKRITKKFSNKVEKSLDALKKYIRYGDALSIVTKIGKLDNGLPDINDIETHIVFVDKDGVPLNIPGNRYDLVGFDKVNPFDEDYDEEDEDDDDE